MFPTVLFFIFFHVLTQTKKDNSLHLFFFCVLQINLRLILVSGKTKEFVFSPNDSAADIAKHVYDNWPMGRQLFMVAHVEENTNLSL